MRELLPRPHASIANYRDCIRRGASRIDQSVAAPQAVVDNEESYTNMTMSAFRLLRSVGSPVKSPAAVLMSSGMLFSTVGVIEAASVYEESWYPTMLTLPVTELFEKLASALAAPFETTENVG